MQKEIKVISLKIRAKIVSNNAFAFKLLTFFCCSHRKEE